MTRARNDVKSKLVVAGACLLLTAAIGCESSKKQSLLQRLPEAPQCGFAFDANHELDGRTAMVTAKVQCDDPAGCAADKPVMRGVYFDVGLELGAMLSDRFAVLSKDESTMIVSAFGLQRDPCSNEPMARGQIQFVYPGTAVLLVRDGATELDRFTFHVSDAASVQLGTGTDGKTFDDLGDGDTLALAPNARLHLRASARDAEGEDLITQGDGVYWLQDAAVAVLGKHGETSSFGADVQLTAAAEGTTKLHVLVSNIERVFDVIVAAP